MRVGASVMNPRAPDVMLLKPGAELTSGILSRLRSLGVWQLWVEHHLTRDLDAAVAPGLTKARLVVFNHLKGDLEKLSRQTISTAQLQTYRRVVIDLVDELVANRAFAGITDQLFAAEAGLITHATNVAYLATLVGLELTSYLIQERPRLSAGRARNLANLGLGGMLHDIGKVALTGGSVHHHEAVEAGERGVPEQYERHPLVGYKMLRGTQAPATVKHAVLNHHQRFDGSGWPRTVRVAGERRRRARVGRRIHVFARIIAAANALDNLLRDAVGNRRPPVAALHDLAGARFDGWFDPVVRLAVLRRVPPFAVGSQVSLNDGRSAVVVGPNLRQPCRPIVRLLEEPEGSDGGQPETIDLEKRPKHFITSCAGENVARWLFTLPDSELDAGSGSSNAPVAA
jgi:HD-GYP domain-containing protein (c-di-GMP phosphodiesterase class II)